MRKTLAVGAVAGLLGGLAMKAVVRLIDPCAFGLSSKTDAETAHKLWRGSGRPPLSEPVAERIGGAMHYAFAAGSGAAYAALYRRFPLLRKGFGTAFGAALWLVGDELAVTLSGLEDARKTPLRSHVSALAAHLLFGLAVAALVEPGSCYPGKRAL